MTTVGKNLRFIFVILATVSIFGISYGANSDFEHDRQVVRVQGSESVVL